MNRITLRIGALAALAVVAGVWGITSRVRADEPAPAEGGEAATAESKDWKEHMGDIPFLVGREAGDAEAEFNGKPPMYFFTTTW